MQTGIIEANLVKLNEEFKLSYIFDLIQLKISGAEKSVLTDINIDFYQQEYHRLFAKLEQAYQNTFLSEKPTAKDALNELLVRVRIASKGGHCPPYS